MNTKRILNIFIWLLRIISIILFIFYIDKKILTSAIVFIILSFLPMIFNKYSKNKINNLLLFLFIILLLNATILGKGLGFYEKFYWWDILVHFLSGTVSYMLGLILFNNMKIKKYQVLCIICFVFTLALSWEIFEFILDTFFKSDHQEWSGKIYEPFSNFLQESKRGAGLVDTMMDMIYAIIAYIFSVIINFFYKKSRNNSTI